MDAIYLHPVRNGHEIFNLQTERTSIRRALTSLPISNNVIKAVEAIAHRQALTNLRMTPRTGKILFDSSWTAGVDYLDEEDEDESDSDNEYTDSDTDADSTNDDTDSIQENLILACTSLGIWRMG